MPKVGIYTKHLCPYCVLAKNHLDSKGVRYNEIDLSKDAVRNREMVNRSNQRTVPQIFIDHQHVGGSDDPLNAEQTGLTHRLLSSEIDHAA